MKKKFGWIAMVLLGAVWSVPASIITYFDATKGASGNTFATGGSLADTSWESGANSTTANTTRWVERLAVPAVGNAFQARALSGSNIPELTTHIVGLPDGTYDVYVFFWDSIAAGNGWNLAAGLVSGSLTTYSFDGLGTTAGVGPASNLTFSGTAPCCTDGENLVRYAVMIGQSTVSNGAGRIDVFIDHVEGGSSASADSANRTWYDGVGLGASDAIVISPPESDPFDVSCSFDGGTNLRFYARGAVDGNKYYLQSTSNLVAASWSNVSSAAYGAAATNWVVPIEQQTAFFRVFGEDAGPGDSIQFQTQFVDYYAQAPPAESLIQGYLDSLASDGSWPDVDYTSTVSGNWPTRDHLDRVVALASAYVSPTSVFYQDAALKTQILAGLSYWLDHDFRNSNWFNSQIGVPERIGNAMVLMGDDIPQEMLDRAFATVFGSGRTSFGATGQNKVWKAGVELRKGWLKDDSALMLQAADEIYSELLVTTGDGIQNDWSFYQHGAMYQQGNYGLSFAESLVNWVYALRDTQYQIDDARLDILRNYLLQGGSWVLWKGMFDLNSCGRQLDQGDQLSKGTLMSRLLSTMASTDQACSAEYQLRLRATNGLAGSKVFWRSDYAMHRRPDWYASVRMCSKRIEGGEDVNNENMLGLHASDGVLLVHQTGLEYANIGGIWNWRRLPGTTVDQGISTLRPTDALMKGRTAFVGGLGDGAYGVSAMDYKRNSLTARKAWFFEADAIICLGAGVNGTTSSNVYTSVEQSLLNGPVTSSLGAVAPGTTVLPAGAWVQHGDIGYQLTQSAAVRVETVSGNWQLLYTDRGARPVTGEVFSVWIDHGVSPTNQTYAYTIFPQTRADEMELKVQSHSTVVLSNTTALQATEGAGGVHAVFYTAGLLVTGSGTEISVSEPCILSLRERALLICDPTHLLSSLTVTLAGQAMQVILPTGADAGRQVTIPL